MPIRHVDYKEMHRHLDARRCKRDLSWRQVAAETDVPPGTFSRLRKGEGCANDAFVSLLVWLNADESIRPFLRSDQE